MYDLSRGDSTGTGTYHIPHMYRKQIHLEEPLCSCRKIPHRTRPEAGASFSTRKDLCYLVVDEDKLQAILYSKLFCPEDVNQALCCKPYDLRDCHFCIQVLLFSEAKSKTEVGLTEDLDLHPETKGTMAFTHDSFDVGSKRELLSMKP